MSNYTFDPRKLVALASGQGVTPAQGGDAKTAIDSIYFSNPAYAQTPFQRAAQGLLGSTDWQAAPQMENPQAESASVLAELAGGADNPQVSAPQQAAQAQPMPQADVQAATPQTDAQTAGAAVADTAAKVTGDPDAAQAAGSVVNQVIAQKNAAQASPNIAQGLLGAYNETPAARYFDEQLAADYARKRDAALLPYREAQYAANDAAIRRADPDTVMGLKRQLIDGLVRAKNAYDAAKAAGNEQGMALAHQAAEQLRGQAQAIGFDLGDYGGNEDASAVAQALANNDARAYMSLIDNDMEPEQYYQKLYNQARDGGMGKRGAAQWAQEMTENYQAERNARMQSAFYTYGIQNGAITPYGMQILTKWAAGEDPQAFLNITTKAFGLPIDEYKLGAQRQLASDQNGYTMQQIDAKSKASMAELMQKIAGELLRDKYGHYYKMDEIGENGKWNLAAAEARGSRSGGGSSSGGSSSSGGKLSAGQTEIVNKATNLLNDVKTGNADPSELHDYVYSDEVKGKLSPDDLDSLRSLDYAAQFYFYKSHGYDGGDSDSSDRAMYNVCAHIANDTSKEWRDTFLPDYNFDAWVGVKPMEE